MNYKLIALRFSSYKNKILFLLKLSLYIQCPYQLRDRPDDAMKNAYIVKTTWHKIYRLRTSPIPDKIMPSNKMQVLNSSTLPVGSAHFT